MTIAKHLTPADLLQKSFPLSLTKNIRSLADALSICFFLLFVRQSRSGTMVHFFTVQDNSSALFSCLPIAYLITISKKWSGCLSGGIRDSPLRLCASAGEPAKGTALRTGSNQSWQ
jgi:hypothetical protein